MIYIFLNIFALVFLGFMTHIIDSKVKSDNVGVSSFALSVLLVTIEAGLYTFILVMQRLWFDALTLHAMKLVFSLDAIAFTMLSFGIINLAIPRKHSFISLIKYGFYIAGCLIVFINFNSIEVTLENGIIIGSKYLFEGQARTFFPWTWVTIYTAIFRYILPTVCFIFLLVFQEDNASQLDKYQSVIIFEAFALMWVINAAIKFIASVDPAFSLLFIYSYLFMYVVIYVALTKTAVPSGKALLVNLLKTFLSYMIPGALIGFLCMINQPMRDNFQPGFLVIYGLGSVLITVLSFWVNSKLSSSTRFYTADYETALERELALIDYTGAEMDEITEQFFDIIKRTVESSSMTVYILSGQNELDVAYSSNNITGKISLTNPIFDNLLNINKSIVVQSQIEKEHDLSVIQSELDEFFKTTKSDALFILNEGHNIFGVITLGKKVSGDHYKEYDYNVFFKLYSYFFVFGYYMRNISNKDVIGVVNREIKMASQIITSIQENIDHVKSTKTDIGYLMVPAHNIGGEFIDMIRLTDNRHLFVVGDLSGKGIAASMNSVILKSIIRTYLAEVHDFKELVVKVNNFVRDSLRKGTIFAGLFALVDFETDTMYYINCGVPALMMYTQVYNNVIEIQGSGHILGFVKDISPYLSVKSTKLNPGDIILACTDGLVQSHSLRGEQFGKERVQQAVLDNSTYPAQRMAQFTFDGLVKFMSKEMEDDVSILVIKYGGTPVEATPVEETTASEEPINSPMEAVADPETETPAEETVETPAEEAKGEEPVESVITEEAPVQESESPAIPADDMGLPEGFEMPDLSDLDAMMKEAGL